MPQIYIIAGPNGAGKTTTAMSLLPNLLHCHEYVNADAIAAGLSPFNLDSAAIQAGRLMLERIHYLAVKKLTFAFESTLASKTFAPFIKECKQQGYQITILFIWLKDTNLVLKRIAERVENGGHHIPDDIAIRRYYRSIRNFFEIYRFLANEWILYNNSDNQSQKIAQQSKDGEIKIHNSIIWSNLFKGNS